MSVTLPKAGGFMVYACGFGVFASIVLVPNFVVVAWVFIICQWFTLGYNEWMKHADKKVDRVSQVH